MPSRSLEAQNLMQFLNKMGTRFQRDLGHLVSSTANAVHRLSPNWDAVLRAEAQARLDHLVGGLYVLYLLSMAEESGVDKQVWRGGLVQSDYEFILAIYHVRHSIAHCDDYRRATSYRQEFDNVMASQRVFPGVVRWSATEIQLDSGAGIQCQTILTNLAQTAVARLV